MTDQDEPDDLVPTTIRIRRSQKEMLDDKAINLSKWVRKRIGEEFDE